MNSYLIGAIIGMIFAIGFFTGYLVDGEKEIITECNNTVGINEFFTEDLNGTINASKLIFKSLEIEWELCSSSGFWRASCFTGSPCNEYKNDSAIKILNLTEENCKRLDALGVEDE